MVQLVCPNCQRNVKIVEVVLVDDPDDKLHAWCPHCKDTTAWSAPWVVKDQTHNARRASGLETDDDLPVLEPHPLHMHLRVGAADQYTEVRRHPEALPVLGDEDPLAVEDRATQKAITWVLQNGGRPIAVHEVRDIEPAQGHVLRVEATVPYVDLTSP